MRWLEIIQENVAPRVLYHGTKPENLGSIMEHGLTAKSDDSWREFGRGVYLTNLIETASQYGPTILSVDLTQLGLNKMRPDDSDLVDYFETRIDPNYEHSDEILDTKGPQEIHECDWLDSLRLVNQCQYIGDIPASALNIVINENASCGATGSASIASAPTAIGGIGVGFDPKGDKGIYNNSKKKKPLILRR